MGSERKKSSNGVIDLLVSEEYVAAGNDLKRIMSWLGCTGGGAQALVKESFVGSSGSLDRTQGLGTKSRTEHRARRYTFFTQMYYSTTRKKATTRLSFKDKVK